jgi:hypothetical protein
MGPVGVLQPQRSFNMAEDEAARKQLAADRVVSEKSRAEFAERMKGKPTPTQEENDLAALGASVLEKEDDGSGPDPNLTPQVEGGKPATYQTRQAAAKPSTPRSTS